MGEMAADAGEEGRASGMEESPEETRDSRAAGHARALVRGRASQASGKGMWVAWNPYSVSLHCGNYSLQLQQGPEVGSALAAVYRSRFVAYS